METIQIGKYVSLAYDIHIIQPDGTQQTVYQYTEQQPDNFVLGNEPGMLPAFIENITGLTSGQDFDFTLTPDKAFGHSKPELIIDVPRDAFAPTPEEFPAEVVVVGATLPMRFADGAVHYGTVTNVGPDVVVMDFNDQLVDQTIRYAGRVLLIRDATEEDLAMNQCGCGCGHDHCGDGGCGDHDGGCDCGHCHGGN